MRGLGRGAGRQRKNSGDLLRGPASLGAQNLLLSTCLVGHNCGNRILLELLKETWCLKGLWGTPDLREETFVIKSSFSMSLCEPGCPSPSLNVVEPGSSFSFSSHPDPPDILRAWAGKWGVTQGWRQSPGWGLWPRSSPNLSDHQPLPKSNPGQSFRVGWLKNKTKHEMCLRVHPCV